MHVLIGHNFYRQPGGEDAVYEATASLLKNHGHRLTRFTVHNDSTETMGRLALAAATFWNRTSSDRLRTTMRDNRPDVAHFMNTFPLISPAAYYAARDARVPVVQTLHNYRLLCVNGLLFREGRVCEDCARSAVGWSGTVRRCYRDSFAASAVTGAMTAFHRLIGTWTNAVDVYVALTEFARRQFVEGGLPASKVVVHPNFLYPDPGVGTGGGRYILFIGRLSAEKGLSLLLDAWGRLGNRPPLKITGDGPLAALVSEAVKEHSAIEVLGLRPPSEVLALMRNAAFLVFPSECYEGLPMAILEAFASGLPVIASGHGGTSAVIEHGRTGLLFRPSDAAELAAAVDWALRNPAAMAKMRSEARAEFEARYTAQSHYRGLIEIYERAMSCG